MNKFYSIEDYKKNAEIKDLEVYTTSCIDAKAYVKEITPTSINKDSVKSDFLTVAQYSQAISLESEEQVQKVEQKLNSNRLYSLARKYSY